jgi:hypothetical protein
MASELKDNTLPLDIINDNNKYPSSGRIIMVMNMVDEQNQEFLARIRIDEKHLPNYEPVYLEELKRQYPERFEEALDFVDQERFRKTSIWTDYFVEAFDGEYWEEFWKAFLSRAYGRGYE